MDPKVGAGLAGTVTAGSSTMLSTGQLQGVVGIATGVITLLAAGIWLIHSLIRLRNERRISDKKAEAFEKQSDYWERKAKHDGLSND